MAQREKFVVLDGHGLIYRSIFRPGPPLTSPRGEPTRGTYTFCQSLFAMFDKVDASYFCVALDSPRRSTFRRLMYPAYKAKREDPDGPPEEVVIQLHRCVEIIDALRLPSFKVESFEADDVIATLVKRCASAEVECVVATRDKDMHQLVGPDCRLFDPTAGEWVGPLDVKQRWGVPADKVVEVMTLMGDSTDNIPGIKGIGKKKALALVKKYGTAEKARKLENLCERPYLDLMRKLVKLRDDVPLDIDPDVLAFDGVKLQNAAPLFRKLGFRTFL